MSFTQSQRGFWNALKDVWVFNWCEAALTCSTTQFSTHVLSTGWSVAVLTYLPARGRPLIIAVQCDADVPQTDAIIATGRCGSAVLGGYIVDWLGFQAIFVATATLQARTCTCHAQRVTSVCAAALLIIRCAQQYRAWVVRWGSSADSRPELGKLQLHEHVCVHSSARQPSWCSCSRWCRATSAVRRQRHLWRTRQRRPCCRQPSWRRSQRPWTTASAERRCRCWSANPVPHPVVEPHRLSPDPNPSLIKLNSHHEVTLKTLFFMPFALMTI